MDGTRFPDSDIFRNGSFTSLALRSRISRGHRPVVDSSKMMQQLDIIADGRQWENSSDTLQPVYLKTTIPLDNDRRVDSKLLASLGALAFPVEILEPVYWNLDIQSLTNLRSLHGHLHAALDGFPPYQAIVKHAPNVLRAILTFRLGPYISLLQLFDHLWSWKCSKCVNFGIYLNLLRCERMCYVCLKWCVQYRPLPFPQAMSIFDLPDESCLDGLPAAWTLPGLYPLWRNSGPNHRPRQRCETHYPVMDPSVVEQVAIKVHGKQAYDKK